VRRLLAPTVGAAVITIGLVSVWILWDASSSPQSKAFISTPQFLVWVLILCAQAAFWVLALGFVLATVYRRALELRHRGVFTPWLVTEIAVAAALVMLLAVAFGLAGRFKFPGIAKTGFKHIPSGDEWPLTHHTLKLPVLLGVALLVGVVALIGMWIVGLALDALGRDTPVGAGDIGRFLGLRTDLNALLAVAGTIIGLGTLATGALRQAILAANNEPFFKKHPQLQLEFDPVYVLAYGLFFTGLLAIAFAPTFVAMREAGTRLRDHAYPMVAPSDPSFREVNERRRALEELLQVNVSATATFKASVAILAPLAGSLVALLLPK